MNCARCHNPESINGDSQLLFEEKKCVLCGACAGVCPEGAASLFKTRCFCLIQSAKSRVLTNL